MTMQTPPSPEVKVPSLTRAVVLAILLIIIDALWLNQGVIAILVGLGLLFIGLPRTLLRKFVPVRSQRLRNLGVYLSAVALVFLLNTLNNRLAQSRAEVLVSAVKSFHSENQRYPQSLEELVPRYIEQVPLAKYTLMFNQFGYIASDNGTYLEYMDMPPFGRPVYSFSRNEWFYLD
ncbi:hypothetical protein [Thiobacillus denitrificans]|uniref:hypothetical protein n=1 Tax=Thiobacillus denitrificans TaxID=36861 RepID=UPI0012FC356A|nr:hypothetical protein [Thiobacillus denitrificans]